LATARPSEAALHDVLARLQAATSELDASAEPDEVARQSAILALRLTRSSYAELSLADGQFSASADGGRFLRQHAATAQLQAGDQNLGTIKVFRAAAYTEGEQLALAIFATQAATAIDSSMRLRSTDRVERAHVLAVQILMAASSHAVTGQNLGDFYHRLAGTVGELVGAGKVLFWRLRDDSLLAPLPAASFGVDRAFLSRLKPTPCVPGGDELAGRVVFDDLIFRANGADAPEFGYVLDTLGVTNAISVPWRAGEERLGLVAAYDSIRSEGFSREDTWVLQKAGLAAGLVTRLWHTQEDLRNSLDRLRKVDGARQMLLKSMATVVDKERKRFVGDLHDDALQKLTAAELLVARTAQKGDVDREALESLRSLLEQTESALRRLIFEVRPPALEGPDGLAQSIRDRVAMLAGSGIRHELDIDLPADMNPDDRTLIFRQVAEALGNAERHAKASVVKISLSELNGGVIGIVEDDGQGFDVAERSNLPGHLGLLALRERALMAGGRYKVDSKPGAGTRVEFWIPLQRDVTA
jgi:signal transduction histidine kinase